MTKVLLYGEMAEVLGRAEWHFELRTPIEAVRALEAVTGKLLRYLYQRGNSAYKIIVDGMLLPDAECVARFSGDFKEIRIVPVVVGAGAGEIFTIVGIGLIGLALAWTPLGIGTYAFLTPAFVGTMGAALLLGGIAQLTLGTGKTDDSNRLTSYIFNGAVNMYTPGGPVPICYGMMRVGSQVISAGISNITYGPTTDSTTTTTTTTTGSVIIDQNIVKQCSYFTVKFKDTYTDPLLSYKVQRLNPAGTWEDCTITTDYEFRDNTQAWKVVDINYAYGFDYQYRIVRMATADIAEKASEPISGIPYITVTSLCRALQERYIVARLAETNATGLNSTHFYTAPYGEMGVGATWPARDMSAGDAYLDLSSIDSQFDSNYRFPPESLLSAFTTGNDATDFNKLKAIRTLIQNGSSSWVGLSYLKTNCIASHDSNSISIKDKTHAQVAAMTLDRNTTASHPDFTDDFNLTVSPWTDTTGTLATRTQMARLLNKFLCKCETFIGTPVIYSGTLGTYHKIYESSETDRASAKSEAWAALNALSWADEAASNVNYGAMMHYHFIDPTWEVILEVANAAYLIDLRGIGQCKYSLYSLLYFHDAYTPTTVEYGDNIANNPYKECMGMPAIVSTPFDGAKYYTADMLGAESAGVKVENTDSTWTISNTDTNAMLQTPWLLENGAQYMSQWDTTNDDESVIGGWWINTDHSIVLIHKSSSPAAGGQWNYYGATQAM